MTILWITKYALTAGIQEREQIEIDGNMATVKEAGALNGRSYFHGDDWQVTRAAAIEQAEKMRKKKIASLKKQIEKLESLTFGS